MKSDDKTAALFDCCKLILVRYDEENADVIDTDGAPVLLEALNCGVYIEDQMDSIQQYTIHLVRLCL